MTVSTTSSQITVAATGASSYQFPFIGVSSSYITLIYTNSSGVAITVPTYNYTVNLNAAVTGQIWGIGGTVVPNSPSNFNGGSLTISRILPLTQAAEISNQGNQYPLVTEEALDLQCMESQQISARGGAYRGTWVSGAIYNFGDIVQDGVNGSYTNNLYICAQANTSGVWATDLANGDWSLVLNVQSLIVSGSYLPLSGGTISGNLGVLGTTSLNNLTVSGTVGGTAFSAFAPLASPAFTGNPTAPTPAANNNTTLLATTAFVQSAAIVGNCRLSYVSTTQIKLSPFQGNKLGFVAGAQSIPSAGVTLANTGLSATTLYYVYAYMNSGVMTLEAVTTAHATDTTTGIEIKSGDTTRTLVGMIYTGSGTPGVFQAAPLLANWFNRQPMSYCPGALGSTALQSNASLGEISSSLRLNFITWLGEAVDTSFIGGIIWSSGTSGITAQVGIGFDTTTAQTNGLSSANIGNTVTNVPIGHRAVVSNLSEGFHYAAALYSGNAGTSSGVNVGTATTVIIQG